MKFFIQTNITYFYFLRVKDWFVFTPMKDIGLLFVAISNSKKRGTNNITKETKVRVEFLKL